MTTSQVVEIPRDILVDMYRRMVLIRTFEERFKKLVETGAPLGSGHSYVGQEAVAVGVCVNLTDADYVATNHRGHGHCLAKGVDPRRMMAELFGKVTGTNRGKGGSMHITDFNKGMLGVNPIVGGAIPHAVGAALSAKFRGTDQVAVSFFGDGAINQGVFAESANLAAIWQLPMIFVCENNLYAESTPVEYAIAGEIVNRGASYNIHSVVADGMDVFDVYEKVREAVNRARAGDGASFIEARTYRFYGHFLGDDPHRYRLADEEEYWRARDPIVQFRQRMTSTGELKQDDLDGVDQEMLTLIEDSVRFAEEGPLPSPEMLYDDVFANPPKGAL
ncbi:MAG: thiamine pyrophosphate-dependent dehydrogenase E1 component subunit alpha [Dehalococcoidia bacterium]